MNIIKLNAVDSTNSYLKKISTERVLEDMTVVMAEYQTQGRGQMGTVWDSQKTKNLMCSVFKRHQFLSVEDHFFISIVTSLAIIKALKQFNVPKMHIKWPNDILSDQKKICGILIENVIKNNKIEASIIGFGLNINQTDFERLPKASSLLNLTGTVFCKEELLMHIWRYLKFYFEYLEHGKHDVLKRAYETLLFRKDKPSTFKDMDGNLFAGFIKGTNLQGGLQVLLEDEVMAEFQLKEIQLLY
ncbi:MAG: biotin--[acetyl-CoA-carboxylase] ligase [Flavobacteriaceae bacterium]|nr:biotin--[acetyl-CoA-carboxylase] ligase [Flavobacteriaceae bacterium]